MRQKGRGEGQEEGAQEPRAGFLVGRSASGNGDLGARHPKGDLGLQFVLQGLNKMKQEL